MDEFLKKYSTKKSWTEYNFKKFCTSEFDKPPSASTMRHRRAAMNWLIGHFSMHSKISLKGVKIRRNKNDGVKL